jgi:hypothetical protein
MEGEILRSLRSLRMTVREKGEEKPGAGGGKRLPDGLAYLLGIMI